MAWEKRDFHGYLQCRETGYGRPSRWKFQIRGFRDDDCSVFMFDMSLDRVPIDSRNRISVLGKKYSPRHWHH